MVGLGSCRSSGDRTRLFILLDPKPPIFRVTRLLPISILKRSPLDHLEALSRFLTSLATTLHQLDERIGFPELSCDGFLAQSRYFPHKEQSSPAISQPLTPDPDFPPDTLNIFAIYSRLHCCQRPEDITANASEGEEPVDCDCSSR